LFGIIFHIILGIYKTSSKLKIKKFQKGVAAGKNEQVRQEEKTEDKISNSKINLIENSMAIEPLLIH
jgi:hypothetical protein